MVSMAKENIHVPSRFRADLQKTPKNLAERLRFFFLGGNQFWETTEDLIVNLKKSDGSMVQYVVHKKFTHDFASVPKFLWGIISPWGRHGPAAILHDSFYKRRVRINGRKEADLLFLQFMEKLEVGLLRRRTMYHAVRACGWLCTDLPA